MAQKKKQWAAIIIMIALFAMIAFVTNLCSPMAVIVKNQFGASDFMAQVGNYGNFIAYLLMGIPSGMLIKKYGYKKTALLALVIGIIGVFVQYMSGWGNIQSFVVYLVGAFIAGFCMCMLNTVVNPMLNTLGGGGKKGNQLVQIGGTFNSAAAVAVYILMGILIKNQDTATIDNANPALFIALGIFVIAFIVILFSKIEEPDDVGKPEKTVAKSGKKESPFSFMHFNLGILAIFLYMGLEVGTPTYMIQYLSSDNDVVRNRKVEVLKQFESNQLASDIAAQNYYGIEEFNKVMKSGDNDAIQSAKKQVAEIESSIKAGKITSAKVGDQTLGIGISVGIATLIAAVYWLLMLVGRFVGGLIGGKVSSRAMITTVALFAIGLLLFGMYADQSWRIEVPGIDWAHLKLIWAEVPVGIVAFLLVGLCTSVMWGGIFNLAVEGLGKFTAMASGVFMTMVFGCAIMVGLQGWLADFSGNYLISYWIPLGCAIYILFYALIGSKVRRRAED